MAIIKVNGPVGITGTIPQGNIANASLGAVTSLPAAISTGKVLQVLSTSTSVSFATTSDSFVDVPNLSLAITPSSTSNKILAMFDCNVGLNNADEIHMNLLRGSTIIGNNSAASTIHATLIPDNYRMNSANYSVLDTPNTTSETTYKIQMKKNGAGATAYVNDRGYNGASSGTNPRWGSSQLTLMEIAG